MSQRKDEIEQANPNAQPEHRDPESDAPRVTALTHRLSRCPAAFLRAPMTRPRGGESIGDIHVGAVVSDLLIRLGNAPLTPGEARSLVLRQSETNTCLLRLMLLCAHILGDAAFQALPPAVSERIRDFFLERKLKALAELQPNAGAFVFDPERREELVRLLLAALQLQPAGENAAESRDRLQTLDSVERERVVAASRAAHKRAQEIREALARKRAQEAASKMSRE